MGLREEKVLPLGFYPCSSWFVHTLFTLALSLLLLKRNNYKRLLAGKVLGLFFFSFQGKEKVFGDLSNAQDLFILFSVHTPVKKTAYSNFIHCNFLFRIQRRKIAMYLVSQCPSLYYYSRIECKCSGRDL